MFSQATAQIRKEQIERDGLAIYPDFFGREEVARLEHVLKEGKSAGKIPISEEMLTHPAVAALAADSRLTSIAQALLHPDAVAFRASLLGETHGKKWMLGWHQDLTLPMRELRDGGGWGPCLIRAGIAHAKSPASALDKVLSIRLALSSISPDGGGATRVLPGTHLLGVMNGTEISRLARERTAMDCNVPAGGVMAMKPLVVHSIGKEARSVASAMLAIDYASPSLLAEGLAVPA